jgi:Protein of unknown function (DUF3105)
VAKKKARTPMPPRTVQAPRRRDTKKGPANPLAEVPRWVWFASVGVVAGAVLILVVLNNTSSSRPSADSVKATMLSAGCTYRDVAPLPPKKDPHDLTTGYHADVPTLSTPTAGLWSTSPPSGGAHYGIWAVWGFYTSPVNVRQVVHDEEHGGVIIWWGPKVSAATVSKLQTFYDQSPDGMFGTPYASLGDKIALTAWTGDPATYYHGSYGMGHIAICSSFDQKAFAAFRTAYVGQGPEGIPLADDKPGCGPQGCP